MVCSEKLRRWSSSSIVLRRWVTGTPPVTHTYTRAIKQPTLHYLTRSVRRAAATCKLTNRKSRIAKKHMSGFATTQEFRPRTECTCTKPETAADDGPDADTSTPPIPPERSEEHTSELQSRGHLVCR